MQIPKRTSRPVQPLDLTRNAVAGQDPGLATGFGAVSSSTRSPGTPAGDSRVSASSVHFTPGARTAWHTHPNGQTIWVTEGVGLCQSRGGPIEVIRPGDRVFFEPGEEHWHGAAATRFMTHIGDAPGRRRGQQRDLGSSTSPTRSTPRRLGVDQLAVRATLMYKAGDVRIEKRSGCPSSSSPPMQSSGSGWPASAAATSGPTSCSSRKPAGRRMGHEAIGIVEAVGLEGRSAQARRPRRDALRLLGRHLRLLATRACTLPVRMGGTSASASSMAPRPRRSACRSRTGTLYKLPVREDDDPIPLAPHALGRDGHRSSCGRNCPREAVARRWP